MTSLNIIPRLDLVDGLMIIGNGEIELKRKSTRFELDYHLDIASFEQASNKHGYAASTQNSSLGF